MNKQNFYVDIHVLQTVPPSCVNRDDTGKSQNSRMAARWKQGFQPIVETCHACYV